MYRRSEVGIAEPCEVRSEQRRLLEFRTRRRDRPRGVREAFYGSSTRYKRVSSIERRCGWAPA